MMSKTVTTRPSAAAFAAAWGGIPTAKAQYNKNDLVPTGPQASRGVFGAWPARRNVIESRHYDALLETNWRFRHARMRKECGPISDPQLRSDCLASFDRDEPFVGSTMAPRIYRTTPGAGY